MHNSDAPEAPPFCPNPECHFHNADRPLWRYVRAGFFARLRSPFRVQRFRCDTCRRYFSTQTFSTSYWLKKPELLIPIFHRLVGCSGYRQIAREFSLSPQTVLTHSARLGRHCQLFHEKKRPATPLEPVGLDSFESFEYSQYHPTGFHLVSGRESHFLYGFTDTERRRSGRMTEAQRRKRLRLEEKYGRPDPRSTEKEVAELLRILVPPGKTLDLTSDEHMDYPRAIRRLPERTIRHQTISSRAARTTRNPLFSINLLDLLIRHSGANHKRETIAFSKRRQSAVERLWVFAAWRNFAKHFSERKRSGSPAMRLGIVDRLLAVPEILKERLFPTRIGLPERWARYYWREIRTRLIPKGTVHRKVYAF